MNLFIYLNLIFKKVIIILFFLKIFPILQDKKKCKKECGPKRKGNHYIFEQQTFHSPHYIKRLQILVSHAPLQISLLALLRHKESLLYLRRWFQGWKKLWKWGSSRNLRADERVIISKSKYNARKGKIASSRGAVPILKMELLLLFFFSLALHSRRLPYRLNVAINLPS